MIGPNYQGQVTSPAQVAFDHPERMLDLFAQAGLAMLAPLGCHPGAPLKQLCDGNVQRQL
jgi:hypothetical protein